MFRPEILAPGGSLEKLKVAVLYGADAVYISGQRYGLRASADNLTDAELELGINFAHARGVKIYVTINGFLHDEDLEGLADFCALLETLKADGIIVSDLGVAKVVQDSCSLALHLSTQSSCLNIASASFWQNEGFSRVVLGREVSIAEASKIRSETGLEVEMFVHGAMCMSYSGRCRISNFTAGRDANRGGCIQSCRFAYGEKGSHENMHLMSSKDLAGLSQLESFSDAEISSLKIEGRMKSVLWVATLTKVYREALDLFIKGELTAKKKSYLESELQTMPHRDYTEASLLSPASSDTIYFSNAAPASNATRQLLGLVLEMHSDEAFVKLYRALRPGAELELLPFTGEAKAFTVDRFYDLLGTELLEAHSGTVVKFKAPENTSAYNILRTLQ